MVALHRGEEELIEKFRKENEYMGSWNPLDELKAYLKEDVAILAEACARHRELFLKTSAKGEDTVTARPLLRAYCHFGKQVLQSVSV